MTESRKAEEGEKAEQEFGFAVRRTLFQEFWDFLRENKKWWLIPIIAMFLLLSLVLVFATHFQALTPFIYTLF